MPLRIITYNTLGYSHDCFRDTDARKEATMNALLDAKVDIALLQEIKTVYQTATGETHRSEDFLGRHPVYCNHTRLAFGDQRCESKEAVGILSRFAFADEGFGLLPRAILNRAYTWARVAVDDDHHCFLMTFHLAAPALGRMITKYGATQEKQEAARERQLRHVEFVLSQMDPRYPVIIGGDFNIEPDQAIFRSWVDRTGLMEIWPSSKENPRKTFATHPSDSFDVGLDLRLDHLLYRNGTEISVQVADCGPIFHERRADEDTFFFGFLSDHIGIYADVEFHRN